MADVFERLFHLCWLSCQAIDFAVKHGRAIRNLFEAGREYSSVEARIGTVSEIGLVRRRFGCDGYPLEMRVIQAAREAPLQLAADLEPTEALFNQYPCRTEHDHLDISRSTLGIEPRIEERRDGCGKRPVDRRGLRPPAMTPSCPPDFGTAAGGFIDRIA